MLWNHRWLLSILCSLTFCSCETADLPKILSLFGWSHVTLVNFQNEPKLLANLSKAGIYFCHENILQPNQCSYDSYSLVVHVTTSNLEDVINCVGKINSESIIVKLDPEVRNSFETRMIFFGQSKSMFVYDSNNEDILRLLYSIRDEQRIVWNKVDFVEKPRAKIRIRRNLQGIAIKDINLPWKPWLEIYNCKAKFQDCETSGVLKNTLDIMGAKYNFSVRHDMEPEGNWGVIPINGGSLLEDNVTMSGVLGGVHNGEYDLAASAWTMGYGRHRLFDFHVSLSDIDYKLFFNLNLELIDYTTFIRPLSASGWISVVGTLMLLCLVMVAVKNFCKRGIKLIQTLAWLFFVVVNACYNGLMTTQLIAAPSLPFTTLTEGLESYPKWQLCLMDEVTYVIQMHTFGANPNPVYQRYWNVIKENPEKYTIPTIRETMDCMNQPGKYVFHSSIQAANYFTQNPEALNNVNLAHTSSGHFQFQATMFLKKGSPYTPLFRETALKLRTIGLIKHFLTSSLNEIPKNKRDEWNPISMQIMLGLLLFLISAIVLSIGIWFCEKYLLPPFVF